MPYAPSSEELLLIKEWDAIFPIIPDIDEEAPNAHEFAEEIWEQLDHLGDAGFDPAKFRVDAYGNVLYWSADPSSPLSWEVDHWFPHLRGGRTVPSNLQIVQWQARQRKKNRLEFLVPWWDLQHGVSISQFLSTFASKNVEFRRRSFALFFADGEDEKVFRYHLGDSRSWSPQHRGKMSSCSMAGGGVSSMGKVKLATSKVSSSTRSAMSANLGGSLTESSNRQQWSPEEEDGLKRGLQKYGPGSWKEIKEQEPVLLNRTMPQIKEKYRVMRDFGKENIASTSVVTGRNDHDNHSDVSNTMQKELRLKKMREEGKREKEKEVARLEETVRTLKAQNEKERLAILELEGNLSKHKQKVEKQRRWAETQSSYRLCLERMIRNAMHQSISYKEQACQNQAACNALMARLDCQDMTCEASEKILQRHSPREALAALGIPGSSGSGQRKPSQGQEIVDVNSRLFLVSKNDGQVVAPCRGLQRYTSGLDTEDEIEEGNSPRRNGFSIQSSFLDVAALQHGSPSTSKGKKKLPREGAKRKAISIGATHAQPTKQAVHRQHFEKGLEGNGPMRSKLMDEKEGSKLPDSQQEICQVEPHGVQGDSSRVMEELIQEVIIAQHDKIQNVEAAALESVKSNDQRLKKAGKSNIDRWLHVLLDEAFPRISPDLAAQSSECQTNGQPPLSPDLSALSMAAIRGSVELEEGRGSPKLLKNGCAEDLKGRLSEIMRKLSVGNTGEESGVDLSRGPNNRLGLRNTSTSFEGFKLSDSSLHEHLQSESVCDITSSIPESVRNWPEGGIKPRGGADWYRDSSSNKVKTSYSKSVKDEPTLSHCLILHKKSVSEDMEGIDWERLSSGNSRALVDNKAGLHHRHGLRATIKACSLKWRRAAKRLDKPLQEGSIPLQE